MFNPNMKSLQAEKLQGKPSIKQLEIQQLTFYLKGERPGNLITDLFQLWGFIFNRLEVKR